MSKFLVTGGAGFIGSHIVETLLKDGHSVRVLDNFSSGKHENLAFTGTVPKRTRDSSRQSNSSSAKGTVPMDMDFELIEGDIRDYQTCQKACQGIDYVLHQAALRSVPKSMENPYDYNEVNINGTLNMLKAARENKVKRFVFASSSSIYGDADIFPQKESHLPKLISPYALTKLAGEYYCRIFTENFGLETVSLRYFNVFGPRQSLDDEYAVVIPKFITCILNDENPPIFGNGRQSRDFTYIDNVVEANLLAATKGLFPHGDRDSPPWGQSLKSKGTVPDNPRETKGTNDESEANLLAATKGLFPQIANPKETKGTVPEGKAAHEVFNVANGKDNTVLQLVDYLNKIIGKNIKPKFLPPRPGDVFRTLADISKIKTILGYAPKVDFEEGLKRTVEWFANAYRL